MYDLILGLHTKTKEVNDVMEAAGTENMAPASPEISA